MDDLFSQPATQSALRIPLFWTHFVVGTCRSSIRHTQRRSTTEPHRWITHSWGDGRSQGLQYGSSWDDPVRHFPGRIDQKNLRLTTKTPTPASRWRGARRQETVAAVETDETANGRKSTSVRYSKTVLCHSITGKRTDDPLFCRRKHTSGITSWVGWQDNGSYNHRSPSDPGAILYLSFPADTWQLRAYWTTSSNPATSATNPDHHGPVTILHYEPTATERQSTLWPSPLS